MFDADTTTIRERKQLLRLLVSEVVITVDRDAAQAAVRIRWEGGTHTEITVALPRRGVDSAIRTEADTLERLRRLAVHYDDATIARLLARQGVMTATGLPFTRDRVGSLRRKHGITGPTALVGPVGDDEHMVSIAEAETLLGTSRATLYRWLASGFIRGEQHGPGGPWRIRIDEELRAKITSHETHPSDGSGSSTPPVDSAWPNRLPWMGSAAASSTPFMPTAANARAWPSNCHCRRTPCSQPTP